MKNRKEPLMKLDFESREILSRISEEYKVDINVLIQAFLIGSMRTIEMFETIAMAKLFNEDYDLSDDIDIKKMN